MRIAVQVEDAQKAELLVELLSAIDFVKRVDVEVTSDTADVSETNDLNGVSATNDFPKPHVSPNREAMLREKAAYQELKESLVKEYLDQYVAIFQGKVIDHDFDEMALIERLNQNFPQETVLIEKVQTGPEPVLHYRSPRLVRDDS